MMRIGLTVFVLTAVVVVALVFYLPERDSSKATVAGEIGSTASGTETDQGDLPVAERKSSVAEVDILFPDNDPLRIAFRPYQINREGLVAADGSYDLLKQHAEAGNEFAAYLLSSLLTKCKRAFQTQEEMEAAINRLQQSNTIVFPGSDREIRIADPDRQMPMAIERIHKDFETCQGITADQKAESAYWLQRSADGGFTIAMTDLASDETDPEAAIDILTRAWAEGEPQALEALARRYYANYQSGVRPTDKVRAYAALYLYTRIVEAAMGPGTGHGEIAGRHVTRVQQTLDAATVDMLSHELAEAIELARSMLESNTNCCYGM